jgi:hypothetical protein
MYGGGGGGEEGRRRRRGGGGGEGEFNANVAGEEGEGDGERSCCTLN